MSRELNINYDVLHQFADANKVNYNELCSAVRAAIPEDAEITRLRAVNAQLVEALDDLLEVCLEELDESKCPQMKIAKAALAAAKR